MNRPRDLTGHHDQNYSQDHQQHMDAEVTGKKTADDRLQEQGTREFDEAITGKGPKMPKSDVSTEDQKALDKALKDTFPASDPVQPAQPNVKAGAPAGRKAT